LVKDGVDHDCTPIETHVVFITSVNCGKILRPGAAKVLQTLTIRAVLNRDWEYSTEYE